MGTTKQCGNCRYWQDKNKIEEGHKLGECCYNPPQLVMGPQQSAIQGHLNMMQLGLSPPCRASRPGCNVHQWSQAHYCGGLAPVENQR